MSIETIKPAVRFGLRERARFDFNGASWVAYDDELLLDVIPAEQFDAETSHTDYSRWCSSTSSAPRAVYIEAGRILNLDVYQSGAEGTVRQPEFESDDNV